MNLLSRTAAAVAIGGASLAAVAGPAFADTGTPSATSSPSSAAGRLSAIQAEAAIDISRRLGALNTAVAKVTTNPVITATDKTTLLGVLNGDVSGLTTLGATIAADTTVSQAATDYQTIFTGYRVYALALPQVRFAAAGDDLTGGVLPLLTSAQSTLEQLLAGVDSGKDSDAVKAAMADLATQIATVSSDSDGLAATVLGYTPADYNANHALLSGPRAQLATARTAARAARADIVTVVGALK
jgi:hypothetical protein